MNPPAHSLDPLFRPRSVAVVGASASPGSVGNILMRNLLANPFGGAVYPVNPKRKVVHGVHCYPDLAAVPERVDLAVIATPGVTVPGLVQECADHGVKGAIIISAGFSELGAEGKALEQRVRQVARGRMRIIGPNCLGVLHPPSNLNASFAASTARPGQVALLSQSGAICTSILDWARAAHVGFSTFVSVGTMLDGKTDRATLAHRLLGTGKEGLQLAPSVRRGLRDLPLGGGLHCKLICRNHRFEHQLVRSVKCLADAVVEPGSAAVQRMEGTEKIDGRVRVAHLPERRRCADDGGGGNRGSLGN